MESLGGLKKHFVSSKDLAAIKNWFLEFYLHTKPYQEEAHINLNKTFYRFHFIVGTFERAMATLEKYLPSDFYLAHLYDYIIKALKRNLFYYEEVLKGTADGEEIAASAGNWDDSNERGEDAFLKVTNKAPRALCMARMVTTKTTITTTTTTTKTLATRRRTRRTMTTTDHNNKTKMKNFSNTMLEFLIWQQIWRSLKLGFRGEREKGGGSN
jgi:hypothetical protein